MNRRTQIRPAYPKMREKGIRDRREYYLPTVTRSEALRSYRNTSRSEDWELVARVVGCVDTLADTVASSCCDVPIRLYEMASKSDVRAIKAHKSGFRDRKAVSHDFKRYVNSGLAGHKAADFGSQGGEMVEVTDGPICDFLSDLNPDWEGGSSMLYLSYYFDQIAGHSYFLQQDGDDGTPAAWWPLFPQHVTPLVDQEEGLYAYAYGRESSRITVYEKKDVVRLVARPHPLDPFSGLGKLEAVREYADLIQANLEYDKGFIEEGARPDWVAMVGASATDDQVKQVYETIDARNRGARNMGRPIILRDGVRVEVPQWSPAELQSLDKIKLNLQILLAAFGVPESMFWMNDANLASSVSGHVQFYRQTVGPQVNRKADQFSESLLPDFDLDPSRYRLIADDPVRMDPKAQSETLRLDVGAAMRTINEARGEIGLPPVPGGDALRFNGQSIEALDRPPPAPGFSVPVNFNNPAPSVTVTGLSADPKETKSAEEPRGDGPSSGEDRPPVDDEQAEKRAPEPEHRTLESVLKACGPWVQEGEPSDCCGADHAPGQDGVCGDGGEAEGESGKSAHHALIQTKDDDDDLRAAVSRLKPILQDAIRDEADRVLREGADAGDTPQDFIDQLAGELENELKDTVVAGFASGMGEVGEIPDDVFDVVPQRALDFLSRYSIQLANDSLGTIADNTRDAITAGLEEGLSLREIASRIEDVSESRAETIARTEVSNALNGGKLEGYKEIGVESKRLLLAPGNCSICRAVVDQTNPGGRESAAIPIDEPFLKGAIAHAGGTYTPRGPVQMPPVHPNCRCAGVAEIGFTSEDES